MNREEIIKINGEEYTVTLNRNSFLLLDKYINFKKLRKIIYEELNEHIDEISDDDDPTIYSDSILDDYIESNKEKEKIYLDSVIRGYYVLLAPKHHLKYSEVKTLLEPVLKNEKELSYLATKLSYYFKECVRLQDKEIKNLKAQTNKEQTKS